MKHVTLLRADWEKSPRKAIAQVEAALKYPVFVKPANLGSSVGISKAHDRKELGPALDLAASYDRKLVVEQGVGRQRSRRPASSKSRVLGNDDPKASVVGEIIPGKEFYDYEAKYLSEGSVPVIPAKLSRAESKQIREMAVAAFRACDLCRPGPRRLPRWSPTAGAASFSTRSTRCPASPRSACIPSCGRRPAFPYQRPDHAADRTGPRAPPRKNRTTYSREE